MSRIGKRIINIPAGVTVSLDGGMFEVKGPKGTLARPFKDDVAIKIDGAEITLLPVKETIFAKALWGTYGSHIANMIEGVTTGFTKKMIIEGVGYKANVQGDKLILDIGFSHTVEEKIPSGVTVTVEKGNITVTGFDKELVGQFSATVRSHKKTEPYKGKGIRYEGEQVRRKQGKKTAA
ncbi:MAG: 50S ribosomal protein L6 [Candidatus Vogelbacteria bacterium RIFOXYD1_FULL_44_32]|uniref:Large ribosomal subunit protein uL6 n=1 Tax=Candidatus Vogelbacteria bacterium RIFOXYD1_FULL_44_32 TaxID=1802438 RepID=A0A1G2QDX1_9BACT|nr:MAG: 50S ribosomal protein L6 [Candidatus Vogelbacteria bacterium RIFOXYD1_FULL_44_32]